LDPRHEKKCIVIILIVFCGIVLWMKFIQMKLFTGYLYYLDYQNPKHFFCIGNIGDMKIIEFPCEIFIMFQKVERLRVRIFFELFCKSCFLRGWWIDWLIDWLRKWRRV
jgi:hypothetical protein